MADEVVVEQNQGPDPEILAEARRGGWRPKDEFNGDPNVWVDAGTFVKRGREVLPHVQRHAAKLEQELATERAARVKLEREQEELRTQVTGLTTFQTELAGKERERIRNELAAELHAARESGDTQAEARILGQLSAPPPAAKPPVQQQPTQQQPTQQQVPAAMTEWLAENSWAKNPVYMQAMSVEGAELRAAGKLNGMDLTAQLNATAKVVAEKYMPNRNNGGPRAESGSRGSGNGGGGQQQSDGPTFEGLSAQAKAECDASGERMGLIGPKKAFKDLAAWRKHYVQQVSRYADGVGYDYKPPGN
jgi:hypothetical protein